MKKDSNSKMESITELGVEKKKDVLNEVKGKGRIVIGAKVTRANGDVEDVGIVADNILDIKEEDAIAFKHFMEENGASKEDLSVLDRLIKQIKGE